MLKRHFARYTPELVEQMNGVPREAFAAVADAVTGNSGRDRTTAFVYSVGWTQHTAGVQNIRTAAILQALLGNMGRPGGGIMALRGHASIQGSTDVPTLFDLPGYLPMPHTGQDDFDSYVRDGQEPARRSARPTPRCSGWAWRTWTGWVVRDLQLIESATFWRDAPEIETGRRKGPVLAAYLSAHRTMINGSALCAARLSRNVTDLAGVAAADLFRTPILCSSHSGLKQGSWRTYQPVRLSSMRVASRPNWARPRWLAA